MSLDATGQVATTRLCGFASHRVPPSRLDSDELRRCRHAVAHACVVIDRSVLLAFLPRELAFISQFARRASWQHQHPCDYSSLIQMDRPCGQRKTASYLAPGPLKSVFARERCSDHKRWGGPMRREMRTCPAQANIGMAACAHVSVRACVRACVRAGASATSVLCTYGDRPPRMMRTATMKRDWRLCR